MTTQEIFEAARSSVRKLALITTDEKNRALRAMAQALRDNADSILAANEKDMVAAKGTLSDVMLDRLLLTRERIEGMAKGAEAVAELPDPVGRVLKENEPRPGLKIQRISCPMGVIGIIYESRPNVTSDAAVLAFKAGSACILRSGKEAWASANAIVTAMKSALDKEGLPSDALWLIEDTSRESATAMMTARGYIDLLIPRGGAGLIRACVENATIPCIETGTGICHVYVEKTAGQEMALNIIENAKTSRPSVCNAEEVCIVDRAIADEFLPKLYKRLCPDRAAAGKNPVELRLDEGAQKIISGIPAGEKDFDTEFLNYILAVKLVDGVDEAIEHISLHSTAHSEAIITTNEEAARKFTTLVDAAAVYVNASTRFTDGGEFGLGCEMGISTQKSLPRGPMGLEELCTYKYIIHGNGNIR